MEGPSPTSWYFLCVLVLPGIELNFFIVARMGVCFGSVLETGLEIQRCFDYGRVGLTQHQSNLSAFSPHPTSERVGGAQGTGREQSQDS